MIDAYFQDFDDVTSNLDFVVSYTNVILSKDLGQFTKGAKFESARFNYLSGLLTLSRSNDKHHFWFNLNAVQEVKQ